LHHFTNPLWLAESGGWENEQVVQLFAEYTRKVVEALGAHCRIWVTINEPNVYMSMAFLQGVFPPGKKDLKLGVQVLANMAKAHAAAYEVIHSLQPEAQVGAAIHWRGFTPGDRNPITRISARQYHQVFNEAFPQTLETGKFITPLLKLDIPEAKGTQDFIGLNYYTRDYLRFAPNQRAEGYTERFFKPDTDLSEHGFLANDPEAFEQAIKWANQFHKPIYITENGCEDSQDDFRRRYLIEHIHALWHMVNYNAPVKGYFHWTLVDNFEWERGWSQRFGLWDLDPQNQIRTKRKSADLYAEICRTDSLSSEMVEKYAPEIYAKIFPE